MASNDLWLNQARTWCRGMIAGGLCLTGGTAMATPIISVDADPLTPGIQSSLMVSLGAIFTVDVLITDNGVPPSPTLFDTVILEASYNDTGMVLGAGPTGPLAGALAASFLSIDVFGLVPVMPGSPLASGPSAPIAGFASGSGAIGLLDPTLFLALPGLPVSIFSLDFTALAVGSSDILAAGTPPGSPELGLGGLGIPASLLAATITVEDSVAVPEPGVLFLMGLGLAGLVCQRQRRRL